jgi:hypothetical protein
MKKESSTLIPFITKLKLLPPYVKIEVNPDRIV